MGPLKKARPTLKKVACHALGKESPSSKDTLWTSNALKYHEVKGIRVKLHMKNLFKIQMWPRIDPLFIPRP